jgi:hypothetical protein
MEWTVRSLRSVIVILASLVLAAHFYRRAQLPVATVCVALPFLLLVTGAWARRTLQLALALGCVEWLRTLWILARERQAAGGPWLRLVLILGVVVILTLIASIWTGRPPRRSVVSR